MLCFQHRNFDSAEMPEVFERQNPSREPGHRSTADRSTKLWGTGLSTSSTIRLGVSPVIILLLGASHFFASTAEPTATPNSTRNKVDSAKTSAQRSNPAAGRSVLTTAQWNRVDRAIDRGLQFISKHQAPDGSFDTHDTARPGVG